MVIKIKGRNKISWKTLTFGIFATKDWGKGCLTVFFFKVGTGPKSAGAFGSKCWQEIQRVNGTLPFFLFVFGQVVWRYILICIMVVTKYWNIQTQQFARFLCLNRLKDLFMCAFQYLLRTLKGELWKIRTYLF